MQNQATAELEIIVSVLIWERITTCWVLWDKRIKIKTQYHNVILVCKLGKEKGKEPRRNLPKKTWETRLEVCLAARHGRSQLINFTFWSWAYFSPYYLTKHTNDFAWCGGALVQVPTLCATRVPAAQSLGEPLLVQNCSLLEMLSFNQSTVRYLSKAQCLVFWLIFVALQANGSFSLYSNQVTVGIVVKNMCFSSQIRTLKNEEKINQSRMSWNIIVWGTLLTK